MGTLYCLFQNQCFLPSGPDLSYLKEPYLKSKTPIPGPSKPPPVLRG